MKFSVNVDEHDYVTKKNHVLRFLGEGDKVKASLRFRGREMAHTNLGRGVLDRLMKDVAEAAVIGREDPITGQAIFAFVSLRGGNEGSEELSKELREHVVKAIGSIARPKTIMFTPELPKTRSGKIMRRLLKQIAAGGEIKGDTTTLEDFGVLARLSQSEE